MKKYILAAALILLAAAITPLLSCSDGESSSSAASDIPAVSSSSRPISSAAVSTTASSRVSTTAPTSERVESWDVSEDRSGSLTASLLRDAADPSKYLLNIEGNGKMHVDAYDLWKAYGGSIIGLSIGVGVTEIGDYAFFEMTALVKVTLPETVTSIGAHAFGSCTSLSEINLPEGLKNIGEYAFSDCKAIVSLSLPSTLESVGACAFLDCGGLGALSIPASLTSIEPLAFASASLVSITVNASNTVYRGAGNCIIEIATKTLHTGCAASVIPADQSVTRIGKGAFYNCSALIEITVPDNVTAIGEQAFFRCTSLQRITLPKRLDSLGMGALYFCSSLVSLTLPEGLATIAPHTLNFCKKLTTLTLPVSVKRIELNVFMGCDSLSAVNYCGTESEWKAITVDKSNTALDGIKINYSATVEPTPTPTPPPTTPPAADLPEPDIPDDSKYADRTPSIGLKYEQKIIGKKVYYAVVGLGDCKDTIVVIPKTYGGYNVTMIAANAFANCDKLTRIIIPEGVELIERSAFAGCTALESITIPSTVTKINNIHYSNFALKRLRVAEGNPVYHSDGNCIIETATKKVVVACPYSTIPSDGSVNTVGEYAFANYPLLKNITIPDSVSVIDDAAFIFSGLESAVIGRGVKKIGESAFNMCSSLTRVYYVGTQAEWNALMAETKGNDPLKKATVIYNYTAE